jgi:transcriptional regulator with XRE-family HTH domain
VNERIRLIRKNLRLTQTEFGKEIGCSQTAVAKYESGLVVPDQTVRILICQKFNVSETWLETGEGKPYREGLIPELVHALRQMPDVQAALERLLPAMTDDDLRALNDVVARFNRKKPPD